MSFNLIILFTKCKAKYLASKDFEVSLQNASSNSVFEKNWNKSTVIYNVEANSNVLDLITASGIVSTEKKLKSTTMFPKKTKGTKISYVLTNQTGRPTTEATFKNKKGLEKKKLPEISSAKTKPTTLKTTNVNIITGSTKIMDKGEKAKITASSKKLVTTTTIETPKRLTTKTTTTIKKTNTKKSIVTTKKPIGTKTIVDRTVTTKKPIGTKTIVDRTVTTKKLIGTKTIVDKTVTTKKPIGTKTIVDRTVTTKKPIETKTIVDRTVTTKKLIGTKTIVDKTVTTKKPIGTKTIVDKTVTTKKPIGTKTIVDKTVTTKKPIGTKTIVDKTVTTKKPIGTTTIISMVKSNNLEIVDVQKLKKIDLITSKNNFLITTATNSYPHNKTSIITTIKPLAIPKMKKCDFEKQIYEHSVTWIYNNLFNVTCDNGNVKVLNCITSLGTQLPLGTRNFVEKNGYHYDCKLRSKLETSHDFSHPLTNKKKRNELDFAPECDEDESQYVRANFMVSCEREEIIGCVDAYGDLVRFGYFVLSRGRLYNCSVGNDGYTAISQWKGCFNGTRDDDPEEKSFHVSLGERWSSGEFVLECGRQGYFVQQCQVNDPETDGAGFFVEAGSAWIDSDNVFNVCQ